MALRIFFTVLAVAFFATSGASIYHNSVSAAPQVAEAGPALGDAPTGMDPRDARRN